MSGSLPPRFVSPRVSGDIHYNTVREVHKTNKNRFRLIPTSSHSASVKPEVIWSSNDLQKSGYGIFEKLKFQNLSEYCS